MALAVIAVAGLVLIVPEEFRLSNSLHYAYCALLFIMLLATLVFLPIILIYTAWVYRVMRGTVTPTSLGRNPNAY